MRRRVVPAPQVSLQWCPMQSNLPLEPIIVASARKHGVRDDALLHAFNNPIRAEDLDDGLTMSSDPITQETSWR
jgi:hypothetical protein